MKTKDYTMSIYQVAALRAKIAKGVATSKQVEELAKLIQLQKEYEAKKDKKAASVLNRFMA